MLICGQIMRDGWASLPAKVFLPPTAFTRSFEMSLWGSLPGMN